MKEDTTETNNKIKIWHQTVSISRALPNTHRFWEFIYYLDGESEFICGTEEKKVKPGDLCVIAPNTLHLLKFNESEGERIVITVPEEYIDRDEVPKDVRYYHGSFPEWAGLFAGLFSVLENGSSYTNRVQQELMRHTGNIILLLLSVFLRNEILQFQYFQQNEVALDIFQFATESTAAEISMQEFSNRFHFSPSGLSKLFKKYCGTSPIGAVIQNRLAHAAMDLIFTDKSIGQIATEYGYQNQSSFTKLFIRNFSCSPSEYRKKYLAIRDHPARIIQVDSVKRLLPYEN